MTAPLRNPWYDSTATPPTMDKKLLEAVWATGSDGCVISLEGDRWALLVDVYLLGRLLRHLLEVYASHLQEFPNLLEFEVGAHRWPPDPGDPPEEGELSPALSFHGRLLPLVTAVAGWVAGGPKPTGFYPDDLTPYYD